MHTASRWTLAGLCLVLAACNDAPLVGPNAPDPVFGIEPEPFKPRRVFEFQAVGPVDGLWAGSLSADAAGPARGLAVRTISSLRRGATIHLVQSWTLDAPGDVGRIIITLSGIVDLTAGRLALDGATRDGVDVRVRGTIAVGRRGGMLTGGEVMFNARSEPPGRLRIGGLSGR